jgi:hypothetical protein
MRAVPTAPLPANTSLSHTSIQVMPLPELFGPLPFGITSSEIPWSVVSGLRAGTGQLSSGVSRGASVNQCSAAGPALSVISTPPANAVSGDVDVGSGSGAAAAGEDTAAASGAPAASAATPPSRRRPRSIGPASRPLSVDPFPIGG